jgi:hypothetical protein
MPPCREHSNLLPMLRACFATRRPRATSGRSSLRMDTRGRDLPQRGEAFPALLREDPGLLVIFSPSCSWVKNNAPLSMIQEGSISLFEWPEWSPSKSNAGSRHAKAEASFAHSKRCREVRLLLQTLKLRHGPRCHDARSVWSAGSLLPLCHETSKTVRPPIRSPQFKSTKK